MRNVFDQYAQPENRLSHALACVLLEDVDFRKAFIRWAGHTLSASAASVRVLEQGVGRISSSDDKQKHLGLPDIWLEDGSAFCLLIESKVAAKLKRDQIQRHLRTAQRRGYSKPLILALTAKNEALPEMPALTCRTWASLYTWLGGQMNRLWPSRLLSYMEILEAQMVEDGYLREGALTEFRGIPFGRDYPYSYLEAKRLLVLAMDELRVDPALAKQLGVDPNNPGRGAITGKAAPGVWDYLGLKAHRKFTAHTHFPHLTLYMTSRNMEIVVTVPNAVDRRVRKALLGESMAEFSSQLKDVCSRLDKLTRTVKGLRAAKPWMEIRQRHYPSQRSEPILDGELNFDLRAAIGRTRGVKNQPQWLAAGYELLSHKQSNIQWSVGLNVPYDRCPALKGRGALRVISGAWMALKPLTDRAYQAIE